METWHATMTPLGRTHPWLRENGHRGIVTSRNKIDEKEGKGMESLPHFSLSRPNYSDSLEYCLCDIRIDGLQQKEIHNWDGNTRRQRTTTTMKRVHSSFTNTHPSTSSLLYEKPNFNVYGIIIVLKLKWNSLWGNWTDTLETRVWVTMMVQERDEWRMRGSEDLEFLIILWCLVSLWSSLMPMPDRITDGTTTVHQRWRCNWSVVRRGGALVGVEAETNG